MDSGPTIPGRRTTPFDNFLESVSDYAIITLDPQGRVLSWNKGAERIKGWRFEDIVGRHISTFYPKETADSGWPDHELELARERGRFEDEGWRIRSDGTRFWANVVITALRAPDGGLMGFAKITRDLTARRNAEEALRRSEERFRLMVESVVDYAIFMLDPDGRVASWNAGAERIKGYKAEEILGRHFSVFYPDDARNRRWPEHELAVARRQGRFEDEGWRIRADGTRFWANVVITALRGGDGEIVGFAKVTRDLTSRRRIEEMERNERRVSDFIAMLAHELRNPLAPMRAAIELIKAGEGNPQTVDVLDRQLGQMTRLVEDLLDVSRITKGRVELQRRPVDLRDLVLATAETVKPLMRARGHTLITEVPPKAVPVDVDPTRITQCIQNLLGNAAKYTPDGGRIELTLESGPTAMITIRDNGVGMEPALLHEAFKPFVQGERELDRREGGLGIGLTLVKSLVELHGGTITAASDGPGRGSAFSFTLPLAHVQPRAPDTASATAAPVQPRRRVLIVDDSYDTARMMAALVTAWGHEAQTAHDGPEALKLAPTFDPEIVLLDIGLPGMNGYEVARRMRGLPATAKATIVACTGYGLDTDRKRASAAGFDAHLVKPVEADALIRLLTAPRPAAPS